MTCLEWWMSEWLGSLWVNSHLTAFAAAFLSIRGSLCLNCSLSYFVHHSLLDLKFVLPWLTSTHSKQGLRRQSNSGVLNRVNCRDSPWSQSYNANWVSNFRFVSHRHFLNQKISCHAYVCPSLFQAYLFWYASEIALCQNLCQGSVERWELFGRDCLSVESDQSQSYSH